MLFALTPWFSERSKGWSKQAAILNQNRGDFAYFANRYAALEFYLWSNINFPEQTEIAKHIQNWKWIGWSIENHSENWSK